MLCESCHANQATVHIATILFASPDQNTHHLCPECAQTAQSTNPLLHSAPPGLPTVHPRPVTGLAVPAQAKIKNIERHLAQFDPLWETFCSRHRYHFLPGRELWPNRMAAAHLSLDYRVALTMDLAFPTVLERGFYPEMPWSLFATASLPLRAPSKAFQPAPVGWRFSRKVLTFDMFRRLPFSQLATVLDKELERAHSLLAGVTPEEVESKGEPPQNCPKPLSPPL